ncbi:unnamed protein product [Ceratitis capitata]|uniref:RNA-directed DNA polymerase n=1 Tax=Ceratitis capitata TaxID=7213 RepID=A0A811UP43_CERCA|nr:unnamed protein product [Ceratitis capitata]
MAQAQDDWTRVGVKLLGKDAYEDFYVKHGMLYKSPTKELVEVPSLMEEEVIRIAYNQGHFSSKRTQEVVEKTFYIPHIAEKVKRVVTSCIQCIISDSKVGRKEGFLEPIDKEDRPLGTFHIDHVGPMEKTTIHHLEVHKISPFKLLSGVDMRVSQLQELNEFLDKEAIEEFTNSRENLRKEAQENIATIRKEYKKNFDSKRKEATVYELNQLVAIKRTQFGSSLRLRPKFFGLYKVIKVMSHSRCEVEKAGQGEGPMRTTTVAENMKKWVPSLEDKRNVWMAECGNV